MPTFNKTKTKSGVKRRASGSRDPYTEHEPGVGRGAGKSIHSSDLLSKRLMMPRRQDPSVHKVTVKLTLQLRASLVAQLVKNLPTVQETGVRSGGQEDPLEK